MVGGSSSASAGRRCCCRPHRTAHTTPVTYYRLLLLSLFVLRAFFFCVRCRERDVKKERKKNQVAKNQLEKRIFFFIRLRMEFKRPAKKGATKRFFFSFLYLSNQVCPSRVRGSSIGVDVIFFLCMCVWVFVCVNLSNHLRPVLERKEKKKGSFIHSADFRRYRIR